MRGLFARISDAGTPVAGTSNAGPPNTGTPDVGTPVVWTLTWRHRLQGYLIGVA